MKIKKIRICGFRGFNELREIDFNEKLTIIYGPNSYGKTSISEALEWLLMGQTSKVEHCQSGINEYKGSYRNIHFKENENAYVEVEIVNGNHNQILIKGLLEPSGNIRKFLNENEIESWPWDDNLDCDASPFILQHALQDILHSKPADRYELFSKIIGTKDLLDLEKEFISLATKYNKPEKVEKFHSDTSEFIRRNSEKEELNSVFKAIKSLSKEKFKEELKLSIKQDLSALAVENFFINETMNNEILEILEANKGETVSQFFDKDLNLKHFSSSDDEEFANKKEITLSKVSNEFINGYYDLEKILAKKGIQELIRFHDLGYKLYEKGNKSQCPFCGTRITDDLKKHIEDSHENFESEIKAFEDYEQKRAYFSEILDDINNALEKIYQILTNNLKGFINVNNKEDLEKIESIFGPENIDEFKKLSLIINGLDTYTKTLTSKKKYIFESFKCIREHFTGQTSDKFDVKKISSEIVSLIAFCDDFYNQIKKFLDSDGDTIIFFLDLLDKYAGTELLSIKIEIVKRYKDIIKFITLEDLISSLKILRSNVVSYVNKKTKDIIDNKLTKDVLKWYDLIKTEGDPDVHFSGFELAGTSSRQQININAQSYGKSLVSAVSSLSESKLNALGLSVKLANNVSTSTPFNFLVVDDPVQSLDDDHSTKFTEIIRSIIEDHQKQIILLSHSQEWLKQIKTGNLSINGDYYEITGYTISGPEINIKEWCSWKSRLLDIEATCNDSKSDTNRLQQAEANLRLLIGQIASIILEKTSGKIKGIDKFSSKEVRSVLIEAGIDNALVDKISQTYETIDDSHHSPEKYSPKSARIKAYCSWVRELAKSAKLT